MPTYPSLSVSPQSGAEFIGARSLQRATNGALRVRVFATAAKQRFRVEHPGLNATDRGTLDTFYATNLAGTFSFVWPLDGQTYTVAFASEPQYKPQGGGYASASVTLEQV